VRIILPDREVTIELKGELAGILALAEGTKPFCAASPAMSAASQKHSHVRARRTDSGTRERPLPRAVAPTSLAAAIGERPAETLNGTRD